MFPESIILVVGSESDECESIARMLSDRYRVVGVETPEDALTHVADGVDLVICELDSAEFSGVQLLGKWKIRDPRTPFVLITNGGDVTSVVEAMKLGAADCVVKPVESSELRAVVSRLLESDATSNIDQDNNGIGGRLAIDIPPGTSLEDLERAAVEQALAQHQGNRTHAAKTLGISVRTLQRKLKAWGMPLLSPQGTEARNSSILYTAPVPTTTTPFSAHAH